MLYVFSIEPSIDWRTREGPAMFANKDAVQRITDFFCKGL